MAPLLESVALSLSMLAPEKRSSSAPSRTRTKVGSEETSYFCVASGTSSTCVDGESGIGKAEKRTYIDLDENDVGTHLSSEGIECRCNHSTGSAPRRRKIEDDEVARGRRYRIVKACRVSRMDHAAAAAADTHHRGRRNRTLLVVETTRCGEEHRGEDEHDHAGCRCVCTDTKDVCL